MRIIELSIVRWMLATMVLASSCFLSWAQVSEPDSRWKQIRVPGPIHVAGTNWLRAWVKVPDSYFSPHPRNLFEESVGLHLQDLAGAHEVWVNGKNIGTGGQFPPAYQSGQDRIHRHKVPAGTLIKDHWNEIAIRLYHPSAPGGFLGPAPFIMDYFLECTFAGTWQWRDDDGYSPGPARAERPDLAAFDTFQESNRVLGRAEQVHGPHLSPTESAAKLKPGPDFQAELLLHEPLITQPTHFSWDDRGRLWVAQYRQYPYPAGLRMVSRDKYYRSHYDKTPPAPPHHDPGADLISIHEDTDNDGLFDHHKVFIDGLNMANAVVHGHGGVWIMHTPYLLFYPDADQDDQPDGAPEVRLEGFGLEDTHAIANGLAWGPDGWLYGAQGSTSSCRVRRPGLDDPATPPVYFEGCMVWRYHPESRAFEIFAEGGGNTFGLDFDSHGRLHSGHNGGGTRGFHFVQGGFYEMQGVNPGKFGPPRNPYAYGNLPQMHSSNAVVRFSHFCVMAEGTALPSSARGHLISLDPLHNVVLTSQRLPVGATFATVDREPALQSDDVTFRPLYIANAPDGSLFISDMCEFYIAHGQHYQNQIDPTTGRIYRLRGKHSMLEQDVDLADKPLSELIDLLDHPNQWHRQTAVRLLGENNPSNAATRKLHRLVTEDSGEASLHALWALHQSGGLDESIATVALRHPHPPVRMWTARLLGDAWGLHRNLGLGAHARHAHPEQAGRLPDSLFRILLQQARVETDPEVLAQFASTARRFDPPQAFPLATAIMTRDEMADDPFIPLLCWWVFAAHLPAAHAELISLLQTPAFWEEPMVNEHLLPRLARRYAADGRRSELQLCADLFRTAPTPAHMTRLMQGFEDGFRGRAMTSLPDDLVAAIMASGQAPLIFRLKQGQENALTEALTAISNPQTELTLRLDLVRALGDVRSPAAVSELLKLCAGREPVALRKAAFAALSPYDQERIGVEIAELLPSLEPGLQTAALTLLTSRPHWSRNLLQALADTTLKADIVPDDLAALLRQSPDKEIAGLARQLLPQHDTDRADVNFTQAMHDLRRTLSHGPGNPYAGEKIFMARCASCHKLFFKGGNLGPDLTAYQRDDLDTLLMGIVNPNAEIREGYHCYTLQTKDGRTLSGFFVERDNQVTVLRGLTGENVTLRSDEIESLQPTGRSLMPEGLLDGLSPQELRDLFAYLRISQPITE